MDLGEFPIALMVIGFLVPLLYCALRRKENLRKAIAIFVMGAVIVALYPIVFKASEISWYIGYPLAQALLFIIIPIAVVSWLERWKIKKVLIEVGVTNKNLVRSIVYGLVAAIIMIAVTFLVTTSGQWDSATSIVLFLSAFSEEFLFRGVLLIYLIRVTGLPIAYATSIISFVLAHSQYLSGDMFIISTIVQAVVLAVVAASTKNIIGPWIGHGLNRIIPPLLKAAIG